MLRGESVCRFSIRRLLDLHHGSIAACFQHLDTLHALIDGGADLKAKNKDGLTALDLAMKLKPDDPNANPFGPGRNKDGVPPPKKMLDTVRPPMRAAVDATSVSKARTKRASSMPPWRTWLLKSQ
jgi:hypothetical protein